MKRLIEGQGATPLDQAIQRVLSSEPALDDSPARRGRIRRALDAPVKRNRPRLAITLVAATLLCVLAGTAFATVPRLLRIVRLASGHPENTGQLAAVASAQAAAPPPAPPPASSAETQTGPLAPQVAATVETPSAAPPRHLATHSAEPPPAASPSDIDLVHEAATALRTGHDPARAAHLLESLRSAGPLAEEALELRIEAALALRDPRAAALGSAYLARYPAGAYREIAERAANARP